jgi:hypothetical protein
MSNSDIADFLCNLSRTTISSINIVRSSFDIDAETGTGTEIETEPDTVAGVDAVVNAESCVGTAAGVVCFVTFCILFVCLFMGMSTSVRMSVGLFVVAKCCV